MESDPLQHNISEEVATGLAKLAELATSVATVNSLLGDPSAAWYQVNLKTFVEVGTIAERIARDVALAGVRAKVFTRIEAAETLGVHANTVSRWLAAEEAEAPSEDATGER